MARGCCRQRRRRAPSTRAARRLRSILRLRHAPAAAAMAATSPAPTQRRRVRHGRNRSHHQLSLCRGASLQASTYRGVGESQGTMAHGDRSRDRTVRVGVHGRRLGGIVGLHDCVPPIRSSAATVTAAGKSSDGKVRLRRLQLQPRAPSSPTSTRKPRPRPASRPKSSRRRPSRGRVPAALQRRARSRPGVLGHGGRRARR